LSHGRSFEDRLLGRLMARRMRRLAAERDEAVPESYSEAFPAVFKEQEELIARYAPGRSFHDTACLWKMNGSCAFLAEASGATSVTASDKWPANEEFEAEHERRGSNVRFAQADLHKLEELEALGTHDVVWASGMLYHTPVPFQMIANLLAVTGEYLIAGSKVVPPVPGLPGAAVFYPGLSAEERNIYSPVAATVAGSPFEPEMHAANWWWGLTPESLVGMASTIRPVELVEEVHLPWNRRNDSYYAVLRLG
jgi:hypothetical protein